MAQIVPAELTDPGALEKFPPRGPKSGGHIEDARPSCRLPLSRRV